MKIFGKEKASLKSNPKGVGPELPEIVALMAKIVERLDALEKKTDLVISQTSLRSFERREHSKPTPKSFVSSQPFRESSPSELPNAVKPARDHSREHTRVRRERVLHKAVCADCQKDCEIPFKPTGERPVYCKECFSKRKAGNPIRVNHGDREEPIPEATESSHVPQRQVSITKKGVGKVTVSEIVSSSARDISQKEKNSLPEKKSKK